MASSSPLSSSSSSLSGSSASPKRGFFSRLVRRQASEPTLPRKLASVSFASSLLSLPVSPELGLRCRLQLQRIDSVVVLHSTRDRKNQLLATLELSLSPEKPRERVGIFHPNNAPVPQEITRSLKEISQLAKLLTFCVRSDRADHCHQPPADECEFCSQLASYLQDHWGGQPLVTVARDGSTALRKAVLGKFLSELIMLATQNDMATTRVAARKPKNAAVVQPAPPPRPTTVHPDEEKEGASEWVAVCSAQDEVAAVLRDFFGVC
ncbi:hypothetical protein BBJ28_00017186 [Nothophytophthora sp. Chile5]|nr:hypothetical protein BBJ28_00017186 [Nothophytophthora sp. Chile5]